MDKSTRIMLERVFGMPADTPDSDVQNFCDHLPLKSQARLRRVLSVFEAGPVEPAMVRADPNDLQQRDIITRGFQLRAQTINEQERSVESVISTEAPVEVYDWRRGETIDEILLASGAQIPDDMPMLSCHARWSLDDVLGSIRGMRADNGDIVGRLFFEHDGDPEGPYNEQGPATRAWNKVRRKHVRDVSVGYRVNEATEIPPGQTATVSGRQYTAGKRTLRVVTNWTPKEGSLVPIGADKSAKIRDDQTFILHLTEGSNVNPKLRAYLESVGLRAEATDAEAQAFLRGLEGDKRQQADAIAAGDGQRSEPPANPPSPPTEGNRGGQPIPPTANQMDAKEVANRAIAEERNRVREITEMAGRDVSDELRQQAINDGWDTARASREFLRNVCERRGPDRSEPPRAPAGHVRSHERDVNARSLAAAMLIQNGCDPTQCRSYDIAGERAGERFSEQDADLGDRIRSLSAPDLFRECVRHDTGHHYRTIEEALAATRHDREMGRAAVSGATLSYVFGTNIYAKLVEGWGVASDSTSGWCEEEDVPNFLAQEEITLNLDGDPELHGRGDTASDATFGDKHETYRAYRFTRKASVDEMDIIDDRLGAIMRIPVMIGQAFRRMRPNLVYSTLLSNPKLVADGKQVFHADHRNLGTDALSAAGLSAALTAIATQRSDNGRDVLDIQGRYLIVPAALSWTAASLLNSVAMAKTHADKSDPNYTPINPVGPSVIKQVIGDNLTLVTDDRIGATGCWDPMTKKMVTGSAKNWFLTAGPFRGVKVVYRRGTNRQPAVRSYILDRGQWGIGWDLVFDIGTAAACYRGLYKSAGTGA